MKPILLITTIITLLISSPLFAGFPGGGSGASGGGVMAGDSLDVLFYVKSSTIEPHSSTLPVAIKLTSGNTSSNICGFYDNSGILQAGISKDSELFVNVIEPVSTTDAFVVQLPVTSTSNNILDCKSKLGVTGFKVDTVGKVYAQVYKANLDTSDVKIRCEGAKSILFQNGTTTKAYIDSAGKGTFDGGVETLDGTGISIGGTAPAESILEFEGRSWVIGRSIAANTGAIVYDPSNTNFTLLASGLNQRAKLDISTLLASEVYTSVIRDSTGPPTATCGILTPSSASITSVDSPYTLTTAISTLYIDASSGFVEVRIPVTDGYNIKLINTVASGANVVTLQMLTGTLNGAANDTTTLDLAYDNCIVEADGTNGFIWN